MVPSGHAVVEPVDGILRVDGELVPDRSLARGAPAGATARRLARGQTNLRVIQKFRRQRPRSRSPLELGILNQSWNFWTLFEGLGTE